MAMTPQEHMLILLVLMKQNQSIKILLDILKSRGVLKGDDSQAFEFSQLQDASSNAALFDDVKRKYLILTESLGIQTGLEQLGKLPEDWFGPQPPPE